MSELLYPISSDIASGSTLPSPNVPIAVLEIGKLHFGGNPTPQEWFHHLKLPSGLPDLVAITILGEIVYWYRPIQGLDEASGKPILLKKFQSDMFQSGAAYYQVKFGFTKSQVRKALKRLEDAGYIRREYREVITKGGIRMTNVMFIEPVIEKIAEITHSRPSGDISSAQSDSTRSAQISDTPTAQISDTSAVQASDTSAAPAGSAPSVQASSPHAAQSGNTRSAQASSTSSAQASSAPSVQPSNTPAAQAGNISPAQADSTPAAPTSGTPSARLGSTSSAPVGSTSSAQASSVPTAQASDTPSPMGETLSPPGDTLSPPGDTLSPPGDTLSPPGDTLSPPGDTLSPQGDTNTKTSTKTSTTTTATSPETGREAAPSHAASRGSSSNLIFDFNLSTFTEGEKERAKQAVASLDPKTAQQVLDELNSALGNGNVKKSKWGWLNEVVNRVKNGTFTPTSDLPERRQALARAAAAQQTKAAKVTSEVWKSHCDELKEAIPAQEFGIHIVPLRGKEDGKTLWLEAPNHYVADWVAGHMSLIERVIGLHTPLDIRVCLG